MSKAPLQITVGVTSRHTRVLAAFALFVVLVLPLAGIRDANAQDSGGFWLASDMDLYDGNQTIRIFGNVGYAIVDYPVAIQVFDQNNNLVHVGQVQADNTGNFELTMSSNLVAGQYIAKATHEFAGSTWATFTIGQLQLPEAVQEAENEVPPIPVPETEDAVPLPVSETGEPTAQPEQPTEWDIVMDGIDIGLDTLLFLLIFAVGHPITTAVFVVSIIVTAYIIRRVRRRRKRSKMLSAGISSTQQYRLVTGLKTAQQTRLLAGKSGITARLKSRFIAFDTNICVSYMCIRFAHDTEMSSTARNLFNGPQSDKMDPDIPDCIDIALDTSRICLPKKTITEFIGRIRQFIDEGEMEWDDLPKLKKARLFEIIIGSQENSEYDRMIKGFSSGDLYSVKRMYDRFANDPSAGMMEAIQKMYDKEEAKAREKNDQARIAEVQDMRANKKSPLGKGDGEILATAMAFAVESRPLCLLTMDGDMLNVADGIQNVIGIEVIGGYRK